MATVGVEAGLGGDDREAAAQLVLRVVDQVVKDLHGHHHPGPASLTSNLERDLGLDSLALEEVLVGLEGAFHLSLPSSILATAETPGDLLASLRVSSRRELVPPAAEPAVVHEAVEEVPVAQGTLLDVLDWHCANQPDRPHIRLLSEDGPEETITYADLHDSATEVARGLVAMGLAHGETVALMLPTSRAYFDTFMGVLLAGGIPVPIYPPARAHEIEDHLRRHARVLSNAGTVMLVTVAEARAVARLLRSTVDPLRSVVTVEDLRRAGDGDPGGGAAGRRTFAARPGPDSIAVLQYTSGSTGQPKGVVLTHSDILANIRSMGEAAATTSKDVFVSWLPLYHDMGLIGAWFASLCLDMTAVIMSPLEFLAHPVRWLEAIDAYGGTITAAPNFAYELCLRRVTDEELRGLDLSSLRIALNGAEPVNAETMERFAERFAPAGLRPSSLFPVYGLAECAVGLAFPPLGRGLVVDVVSPEALQRDGRAEPVSAAAGEGIRFVACGQPLPGYEIRVVDAAGRELPERREGGIEFRGPSATPGYYRNEAATAALLHDGWLVTGDLGYFAEGDLYITGRTKDLIIRAGRNLHPEELESLVGELPGVRKGSVAVFAAHDRHATERLVVIAETRETGEEARQELRSRIVATAVDILGTPPDDVVLAPPGTVLKTSSGKLRRAACADLYERGAIGTRGRPVWWQVLRFTMSGTGPRIRQRRRALASLAYALWCWVILAAVVGPALVLLAVVPGQRLRRRVARAGARTLVGLSGIPVSVVGGEHLPHEPCIAVANHESWLDAFLLTAYLPTGFTFVAGEVFERQHLAGFILRRIGAEFVDRHDPSQAAVTVAHLAHLAASRPLVIFPEGGLSRAPGLRPFHLGAFVAATDARRPVLPIAIRGSRSLLRAGQRFVRRGSVTITIGEAIPPSGEGWLGARRLERDVRAVILRHCGEPDLA